MGSAAELARPVVSREEAIRLGLKKFFTGKPCNYGHLAERYVSGGRCATCKLAVKAAPGFQKAYREKNKAALAIKDKARRDKNKDAKAAYNAAYAEANKDRLLAYAREYREKNKSKIDEYKGGYRARRAEEIRAYRLNNRWLANIHRATRRARRIQATPPWANLEAIRLIYREASSSGLHVDHIIPLKNDLVCGLHVEANLALLEPLENQKKFNRFDPSEHSWQASR